MPRTAPGPPSAAAHLPHAECIGCSVKSTLDPRQHVLLMPKRQVCSMTSRSCRRSMRLQTVSVSSASVVSPTGAQSLVGWSSTHSMAANVTKLGSRWSCTAAGVRCCSWGFSTALRPTLLKAEYLSVALHTKIAQNHACLAFLAG